MSLEKIFCRKSTFLNILLLAWPGCFPRKPGARSKSQAALFAEFVVIPGEPPWQRVRDLERQYWRRGKGIQNCGWKMDSLPSSRPGGLASPGMTSQVSRQGVERTGPNAAGRTLA
jgi:hypothetical protein